MLSDLGWRAHQAGHICPDLGDLANGAELARTLRLEACLRVWVLHELVACTTSVKLELSNDCCTQLFQVMAEQAAANR